MLLKNTESKSSINFSIKNLIQDKSKSTGSNCCRYLSEYMLELLWEIIIAIIECPKLSYGIELS